MRFNPRARDGREDQEYQYPALSEVSIHAPVMDANQGMRMAADDAKFQSTRP